MDKTKLIKIHQADFAAAYLGLQNTLGGNPISLLMTESSVAAIEHAGECLKAMHEIATLCHVKEVPGEQQSIQVLDGGLSNDSIIDELNHQELANGTLKNENHSDGTPLNDSTIDTLNHQELTDGPLKTEENSGDEKKSEKKKKKAVQDKDTEDTDSEK
ncbi:hypothetical protein RJD38_21165 [Vibrio scophthalmi]|uniref:hypothetical protein n=1 Tax=Vibrio scophthalmi TaxID=45658 RepID=UPI00349FC02A